MAMLKNVELWWVKCDPKRPEKNQDSSKPDFWSIQIRETDKVRVKELRDLGIPMKAVREDPNDDESPIAFYRATLRKKTKNVRGDDLDPVNVVTGQLESLDPRKIGNGSIANVKVFQYEYEFEGKKGTANMLMAIQVTKLNEYVPRDDEEDFEPADYEVSTVGDRNGDQNEGEALDDEIPF